MNADDPPSPPISTPSTADHLENISRRIATLISQRNWTHPDWSHVSQDYESYNRDAFVEETSAPITSTRDEFMAHYKKFMEEYPDYEIELDRFDVQIDEERGIARTWNVYVVTGQPPSIRKESVSQFSWVKRDGRWIVVKQSAIRGAPGY